MVVAYSIVKLFPNFFITFLKLFNYFFSTEKVVFLFYNYSMNSLSMIFNPYLSCDEKDMLIELIRLEEESDISELSAVSAVHEPLSVSATNTAYSASTSSTADTDCTATTSDQPRIAMGAG